MKYAYIIAAALGLFLARPAIHTIRQMIKPRRRMDHQGSAATDGYDEGKNESEVRLKHCDQVAKLKALRRVRAKRRLNRSWKKIAG